MRLAHPSSPEAKESRAGLTRLELVVLVGVVVVLATFSIVPLEQHLEQTRISRAVNSGRTLDVLLSQYATDNDGVYPTGLGTKAAGKSEGIARNLLENNYTPDAGLFALGSAPKYSGTSSNFEDIRPANVSWDFTAGATTSTGITSAAPELLPTVYTTGETVLYPKVAGSGLNLPLSGNGLFGKDGLVVAYKGGNAVFIKGVLSGATMEAPGFISPELKETGTYTQIRP